MGLSTALSNAYTGLVASSRRAEVTAHNIANATTEGYARRSVDLSAQSIDGRGLGVLVEGVRLATTPALTADRRGADADLGWQEEIADTAVTLERLVGGPDDPGSLFERYDRLEESLRTLSNAPQSTQGQLDVLAKASDLTVAFHDMNEGVLTVRRNADAEIGRQVDRLNELLPQILDLNRDVQRSVAREIDYAELQAQRDTLIDEITSILPVKVWPRDDGRVEITTVNGLSLVDSDAAVFSFTPAGVISSDMDLVGGAPGALSVLTVDGVDVTPSTDSNDAIGGGLLAALFQTRDVTTVTFQTRIDALAGDLVARFSTAATEPAIAVGDPGVFTDAGGAPTGVAGLAGRLSLNALVDPDQGGAITAFRDGIGAPIGDVGDNAHAIALLAAMTDAQTAPAGSGLVGAKSVIEFAADFASLVATDSQRGEATLVMRQARRDTYYNAEIGANGVDMDRELQELTLIQNAYSANARVMQVVDSLFRTLMEI